MSRRLKIATIAGLLVILVVVLVAWKRAGVPRYEGRTMEEWFKAAYEITYPNPSREADEAEVHRIESAFRHFGTNAVPFLAGRITSDLNDSKKDQLLGKLEDASPQPIRKMMPTQRLRRMEALLAALYLADNIKPDSSQLLPLLQPALHGTNDLQRGCALLALGGVGGSKGKAWPYLLKALEDSDSLVKANAAWSITNFTREASQSLPEILRIASSTNETSRSAIFALKLLGTNASAVIPQLEQMLASEADERRRKALSKALKSVRGTPGANEPE